MLTNQNSGWEERVRGAVTLSKCIYYLHKFDEALEWCNDAMMGRDRTEARWVMEEEEEGQGVNPVLQQQLDEGVRKTEREWLTDIQAINKLKQEAIPLVQMAIDHYAANIA
jgi:hypothetical protein